MKKVVIGCYKFQQILNSAKFPYEVIKNLNLNNDNSYIVFEQTKKGQYIIRKHQPSDVNIPLSKERFNF